MTSARKIRANQTNARSSTGPRTASGKAHAAQNARRHGLSVTVVSDPVLSEQVASLAHEICADLKDRELYQLACDVAEAETELNRVRRARHNLLVRNIADPKWELKFMTKEREREIRREIKLRGPFPRHLLYLRDYTQPEGAQKIGVILLGLEKQLKIMDRYERRARSRRKFAIRTFDRVRQSLDARMQPQTP
jgi:hypothetical protein